MAYQGFSTIVDNLVKTRWDKKIFLSSALGKKFLTSGVVPSPMSSSGGNPPNDLSALQQFTSVDWGNLPTSLKLKIASMDDYEFISPTPNNPADITAEVARYNVQEMVVYIKSLAYKWQNLEAICQTLVGSPSAAEQALREHLSNAFFIYLNKLVGKVIQNLSNIPEVTLGDGTGHLSDAMIREARLLMGEEGFDRPIGFMYMSSATLHAILTLQEGGQIKRVMIDTDTHMRASGGDIEQVHVNETIYRYDGVTPVVICDQMPVGTISLLRRGAFTFMLHPDIKIVAQENVLSHRGGGSTTILQRVPFVLHPIGFNTKVDLIPGTFDEFGPSLSQLESATALYEPINARLTSVINLRIKLTV